LQSLSEALLFAEASNLDITKLVETISKGAAGSWQMKNRSKSMSEGHYEHGFAVDWMRKDLNIAMTEAKSLNLDLPITQLIDQYYAEVQQLGGGRWDTSSLLYRLQHHSEE
jgi:3-hydroxyisobutyrate dehydrogenase-like beta-hydroxyacid dehydrogenase